MSDLEIIKKYYGERFSHLCRSLFPTILEESGTLSNIILKYFEPNKDLYEDIVNNKLIDEFSEYIYSVILKKDKVKEEIIPKTPYELMSEAGYELFECHTENDIQRFKKYYKKGEELCTFKGERLNSCYVFFAVKNNASKLKRNDFKTPNRQDEYGTSVISIQFSRGNVNTLSIKNRYNHTVDNPDSTFSNNLDNIIEGLTESFRYHCDLNFEYNNYDFEIPRYVKASDGKYYKYNYEINNIYYCPNNIIIDNFEVNRDYLEKERYIVLDYFILDLKEKTIKLYDSSLNDAFEDAFNNIDKIYVKKDGDGNKEITIIIPNMEDIVIKINKHNKIISYKNNNLEEIGDCFLFRNVDLENIEINNVLNIKDDFLRLNKNIRNINLPLVKKVGADFLRCNNKITNINIPNVEIIDDNFLESSYNVKDIHLPKVKKIGNLFMIGCANLENIYAPSLILVGDMFLAHNREIKNLYFPKLMIIKHGFFYYNNLISSVYLPFVEEIGSNFLGQNQQLKSLYLPEVKKIGHSFLEFNNKITRIVIPNVLSIDYGFMFNNNSLVSFKAPNLISVGSDFLPNNIKLKIFDASKIETIGDKFLYINKSLEKLILPNVKKIGYYALCYNEKIKELDIRSVEVIGSSSFHHNKWLTSLSVPKLRIIGSSAFGYNNNVSFNKLRKSALVNKVIYCIKHLLYNITDGNIKEVNNHKIRN